jgi:hypothetical protein
VECRLRDVAPWFSGPRPRHIDLEQGAERAGEVFQQVYERPLSVVKART